MADFLAEFLDGKVFGRRVLDQLSLSERWRDVKYPPLDL
jgi:hypothetical protein